MTDQTRRPSNSENMADAEKLLQIVKPAGESETSVQPTATKKRTAIRNATWIAWTGTIGELRRTNGLFEEVVDCCRDEITRSLSEKDKMSKSPALERLNLTPEAMIATANNDKVSGRFEDVIADLDPRTWAMIRLHAGEESDSNEYLSLEFPRTPDVSDASVVELTVKSANPGTAAGSLIRLTEQLDLGKPRWAWLHKPAAPRITFLISWIIVMCSVTAVLARRWPIDQWGIPTLIAVGLMAVAGVVLTLSIVPTRLMRRVLPPAEIRYDNIQQSSGTRFIGSLLALWIIPAVLAVVLTLVP